MDDQGNQPVAPQPGALLELTRTDGPAALLLVEGVQGESIVGRILDGAIPYEVDPSLPPIPGGYPEGVVGLKPAGGTTLTYRLAVDASGLAASPGTGIDVDTDVGSPVDGYWVARDELGNVLAVLRKTGTTVTLLHGRATDGAELNRLGDTSGTIWTLRAPDRVATLDGGKSPHMQRDFTYTVEVEGDMDAVDAAGQGLRDRLAESGSATLYAVGPDGKPQAVTVTAVNLTLGLIDISGPASLLRAGVALYDAGQGEAFETDVALNLRDTVRPALRLEREVDAEGAQNGARRFAYIEAAPLEGSARARVFDVLATATSDRPVELYDSLGNAVLIRGANETAGTVTFQFAIADINQTGAQRARLAFGDMALYATPTANAKTDRPVLRLVGQVEGTAQALTMSASRVADAATTTDLAPDVTLGGLGQPLFEGLQVAQLSNSTIAKVYQVTGRDLDTSELNLSIGDSGAASTTELTLDAALAQEVAVESVVVNLDTAIIRLPAGFDGTFIEGQPVYSMVWNGTAWVQSKIGTVKVFKAGAGELHVTLDHANSTQYVAFGDRIWSEYVAMGAEAHRGTVVNAQPDDLKLVNKQIVWSGVEKGDVENLVANAEDGLISEDGRTLFEIGYFGPARDTFGNVLPGDTYDLVFNRVRVPFQPFNPSQELSLLSRDDDTFSNELDRVVVGNGALDVSFGPAGWQVRITQSSVEDFEAAIADYLESGDEIDPDLFKTMVDHPDRDGLYISSLPKAPGQRGLDSGRVIGWDPAGRIITLEVVESDRAEANLADNLNGAFYLREAPVFRLDDKLLYDPAVITGADRDPFDVVRTGNRISVTIPRFQAEANWPLDADYTNIYLLDKDSDELVATARIDRQATQDGFNAAAADAPTLMVYADAVNGAYGWSSFDSAQHKIVLAEPFDQIARINSVSEVSTDEETGVRSVEVKLHADAPVHIEYKPRRWHAALRAGDRDERRHARKRCDLRQGTESVGRRCLPVTR